MAAQRYSSCPGLEARAIETGTTAVLAVMPTSVEEPGPKGSGRNIAIPLPCCSRLTSPLMHRKDREYLLPRAGHARRCATPLIVSRVVSFRTRGFGRRSADLGHLRLSALGGRAHLAA